MTRHAHKNFSPKTTGSSGFSTQATRSPCLVHSTSFSAPSSDISVCLTSLCIGHKNLQDRFEEFLKSKNIYTKEIDDYDDFMEVWVDNYDEDLDFDDLYDIYDLELSVADDTDPDDYDILLDEDIDYLYDDYLDDYIDEEYFDEYGEYFDEVYYD